MKAYMEKAETYYNGLIGKNNVQWIDSKYFKRTLKQGLKKRLRTTSRYDKSL